MLKVYFWQSPHVSMSVLSKQHKNKLFADGLYLSFGGKTLTRAELDWSNEKQVSTMNAIRLLSFVKARYDKVKTLPQHYDDEQKKSAQHADSLIRDADMPSMIAILDNQYPALYSKEHDQENYFGCADAIRLPTIEEGFTHGLSESAASYQIASEYYRNDFDIFDNNCADSALRVLNAAKPKDIEIAADRKITIFANPDIPTPIGSSVKKYCRELRKKILHKTIEDNEIEIVAKVRQVINMEIVRLEDGINNIQNHSFLHKYLGARCQEVNNKEEKLAVLQTFKNNYVRDNIEPAVLLRCLKVTIQHSEETLAKGFFRANTYESLTKLYSHCYAQLESAKQLEQRPLESLAAKEQSGKCADELSDTISTADLSGFAPGISF